MTFEGNCFAQSLRARLGCDQHQAACGLADAWCLSAFLQMALALSDDPDCRGEF